MSNNTQPNPSSTRPGVGARIRGVFETAHGIGENIRGRTLGAIDDVTNTGSPGSKSHYTSIADRGRMETEKGMARVYGYPDPNTANVPRNEPGRLPQSNMGTFGNGHTTGTGPGTGYMRTGGNDHDYRGPVSGVGSGAGGYGVDDRADDGYGQPGVQNFEHQRPAVDGNTEMAPEPSVRGRLSPNRGPQNAGPEGGWPPTSQAGAPAPTQQRVKEDFPPGLPPRPQAQATDNDQRTQMYQ